jgi:hypothetical protein
MSPTRKWWFVGGSVLLLAACTQPAGPTLLNPAQPVTSLRITIATTGGALDPDGYAACVDPAPDGHGGTSCAYAGPLAVWVNGFWTVIVDTGPHAVLLTGLAANCTVTGDNPRAVSVARGETAAVPFAVACAAATLHITTTTTGVSFDPDGYGLCVDPRPDPWDFGNFCTPYETIGVNSGVSVPVAAGTHVVELDGVDFNCTVSGDNPRTVTANDSTEVPFAVTCTATGSVKVTTATRGTDIDPDGYLVCVDRSGSDCQWNARAHANDQVTIAGVTTGLHTVRLIGAAGNCSVGGTTARAVTVPSDGAAAVTFDVGCVVAERIAYSTPGTIVVSQLDGSVTQVIAPGFAPAWSPDGARLAYECGQDICAINADSTGFARLTVDATGNHRPTWSPDGSKIAFAATHAGVADLYVMGASGSGAVRLTQGVGFVGSPAWSPDGTKIAFDCRVDAANDDLCSVNADGSGFARLTNDPARDYGAAWKPDGSTLAFATTRYLGDQIAVLNVAGGGVMRAGLDGFGPTWSPDGTQLAFVQTLEDCGGWDYSRPAASGGARSPRPRGASGCRRYDVVSVAHSDGSNVRVFTTGNQPAWRPHP